MTTQNHNLTEDDVRKIVRNEIKLNEVKIEELSYKNLSETEKLELLEAKEQYKQNKTYSFDDVYKEVMND